MGLRSRARRVFGREKAEHAVVAPKVHHAVFNDLRRRSERIDEIASTPPSLGGDALDGKVWERLCEDVFAEFFGGDEPTVRGRDKIDPRFRLNRELADKQARSEQFIDLHSMTRNQRTESALAWMTAMETIGDAYGDELREHGERQNEIADCEDHLDSLDDQLAKLREQRQDATGSEVGAIDEQIRDLAAQKREAKGRLGEAVQAQQANVGSLVESARAVAASATSAARDAAEVASLLPGSGAGQAQTLSTEQMIEFADRVTDNPVLAQVLEMMGRMKLSMGSKRRQLRKGGNEEMVDIETGNDLQFVLPQERALLVHPVAKLDFYRRFHEQALMQYEMWSEQELKKGPLIVIADGSASMSGAKNTFARGLSLAAISIAHEEGRNAAAIEFGSAGQLRTFTFPKDGALDIPMALDFAEHFFCGGTNIDGALARAHSLIDSEAPFHTADLVILTDGIDRVTEGTLRIRDELREAGVKLHGIAIGMPPTEYLLTTCDGVSSVFDYAGPNATSDRLAIDIS